MTFIFSRPSDATPGTLSCISVQCAEDSFGSGGRLEFAEAGVGFQWPFAVFFRPKTSSTCSLDSQRSKIARGFPASIRRRIRIRQYFHHSFVERDFGLLSPVFTQL